MATTLLCVPILVESPADAADAIHDAGVAVRLGATAIEWRVDPLVLDADGPAAARRLVAESPAPCILTARDAEEGGAADIDDDDRAAFLSEVAADASGPRSRPTWLDVEEAAWVRSPALRTAALALLGPEDAATSRLILSMHDFRGPPSDLWTRVERAANEPRCAVVKVAWTARSLRDLAELAHLLAHRPKPMIALAMGPYGLASRVMAARLGGMLTFATLGDGRSTAPGQPTLAAMQRIYRVERIGRRTALYGIIGSPVEHSLGPRLHNAGFAAAGVDAVYLPLPVDPGWESFKATLGVLLHEPQLGFAGASVTIPHKANLLRFVREAGGTVTAAAARCGAANTLVVTRGGDGHGPPELVADNTDAPAIVDAVRNAGLDPTGLRVAILGAGGAARAAAAGLAAAGARIIVHGRTPSRVAELCRDLHGQPGDAPGATLDVVAGDGAGPISAAEVDLVVNATPAGMATGDDPAGDPLSAAFDLGPGHTVFDTVYAPLDTPLVLRARAAGASVITGDAMFVGQAARQFRAWTGRNLPDAALAAIAPAP